MYQSSPAIEATKAQILDVAIRSSVSNTLNDHLPVLNAIYEYNSTNSNQARLALAKALNVDSDRLKEGREKWSAQFNKDIAKALSIEPSKISTDYDGVIVDVRYLQQQGPEKVLAVFQIPPLKEGEKISPEKLLGNNYVVRFDTLKEAMSNLCGSDRSNCPDGSIFPNSPYNPSGVKFVSSDNSKSK